MSHVERSTTIEASATDVWAVVADLDAVASWNPNVSSAVCGPQTTGLGATRTCHLKPTGRIDEVVSGWIDGEQIWFAVDDHGAIRSADMGLVVKAEPAVADGPRTTVSAIADYHLAFGPLGPVIDALTVRRLMTRMLDGALGGLKQHLESNERPTSESEST